MMKLDNSKRMAALKGMLKEEKKKNKDKKEKKDKKKSSPGGSTSHTTTTSSRVSDGSVSTEGKTSSASKKTASSSAVDSGRGLPSRSRMLHRAASQTRLRDGPLAEEEAMMMGTVNPKSALKLQASWESIQRTLPEYEFRVGEELILAMLEIHPNLLRAMGIKSFRSNDFEAVCKRLTHHVDYFIHMTGPSVSQELQVLDVRSELERDHIDPTVLADALPTAIKAILGDDDAYTAETEELWGYTFAKHIVRMTRDPDDASTGDFGL